MLLLIDNYDSFTWNLYQYFCELGAEVCVRRNDAITLDEISQLAPRQLVSSNRCASTGRMGHARSRREHLARKRFLG